MAISMNEGGNNKILHPFYDTSDYISHDQQAGTLDLATGTRGLHVTEDFIVGLQGGLEEEVGDAAGMVMYKAGYEWGLQDMKVFEDRKSVV